MFFIFLKEKQYDFKGFSVGDEEQKNCRVSSA